MCLRVFAGSLASMSIFLTLGPAAISQVAPEGNSQLSAGLLQRRVGDSGFYLGRSWICLRKPLKLFSASNSARSRLLLAGGQVAITLESQRGCDASVLGDQLPVSSGC
jgi:hypothetical protein